MSTDGCKGWPKKHASGLMFPNRPPQPGSLATPALTFLSPAKSLQWGRKRKSLHQQFTIGHPKCQCTQPLLDCLSQQKNITGAQIINKQKTHSLQTVHVALSPSERNLFRTCLSGERRHHSQVPRIPKFDFIIQTSINY